MVKDRGRPSRLCISEMVYNCDCRLMTYAVAMLAPDLKISRATVATNREGSGAEGTCCAAKRRIFDQK